MEACICGKEDNMKTKRISLKLIVLALVLALICGALSGCGEKEQKAANENRVATSMRLTPDNDEQ